MEATKLENKINDLVKNKIDVDGIQENRKELIKKNNKSVWKTQQKFKSFTEEINKIALSSNNDERMQSIDLTETYAYGTSKWQRND